MTERVVPFHFGPTGMLFGILHPAPAPADVVTVLCPALDAEYSRGHRALQLLATRLAANGRPVLRFDPSGCGDSDDLGRESLMGFWYSDVLFAIDEAQRRTGAARVDLVGVRLSATFAASAACDDHVRSLVLWDPIASGAAWMEELSAAHAALVAGVPGGADTKGGELLGFEYPRPLRDGLTVLGGPVPGNARHLRVLVLETGTPSGSEPLATSFQERGARVEHEQVEGPDLWRADERAALVPAAALRAVQTWLEAAE